MKRNKVRFLFVCLFFLSSVCMVLAQPQADIVRRCKKATVLVTAKDTEGSAFCIDGSGLFITNQHVIEDADGENKVIVILNPGETGQKKVEAIVVRSDKDLDLALIKIKSVEPVTPLDLGDSDELFETMPFTAYGYPFGSDLAQKDNEYPNVTVNLGHITALRKSAGSLDMIQLDASLNPGSSGGPIVDDKGKVIGIVKEGIPGAGINYAIPVSKLRQFLSNVTIDFAPPVVTPANISQEREFRISTTVGLLPLLPTDACSETLWQSLDVPAAIATRAGSAVLPTG